MTRRPARRSIAALLFAAVVAAAPGCSSSASSVAADQYLKTSSKLCDHAQRDIYALNDRDPGNIEARREIVTKLRSDLKALRVPAGERELRALTNDYVAVLGDSVDHSGTVTDSMFEAKREPLTRAEEDYIRAHPAAKPNAGSPDNTALLFCSDLSVAPGAGG